MRLTRKSLVSLVTIGVLISPLSLRAAGVADDEPADAIRLSLSECLGMALDHNLDLAIAKKDPQIAEYAVTFEKAAFDPLLEAGLNHTALRRESTNTTTVPPAAPVSTTQSARTINDSLNGSISQTLSFGARYTITVAGSTSPGTVNEVFIPSFPLLYTDTSERPYSWNYGFNFTLPLPPEKGGRGVSGRRRASGSAGWPSGRIFLGSRRG